MKAFQDNKLNVDEMIFAAFHRVENSAGKSENAGYQSSFYGSVKVEVVRSPILRNNNWPI